MRTNTNTRRRPRLPMDPASWPTFGPEDWPALDPPQWFSIGPGDWPRLKDEDPAQEDLTPPHHSRRQIGLKGETEHRKNNPQPAAAFYFDYHKRP